MCPTTAQYGVQTCVRRVDSLLSPNFEGYYLSKPLELCILHSSTEYVHRSGLLIVSSGALFLGKLFCHAFRDHDGEGISVICS